MMLIKDDEQTYNFPVKNGINIIVENYLSTKIINNLVNYFANKKKTSCIVYDDDNDLISCKEFDFVYFDPKENLENNYLLKEKTTLKKFVDNVILENPESFISVDRIRENLYSLLTDKGFNRINNILFNGLSIKPELNVEKYDASLITNMIAYDIDGIDKSKLLAAIYNAMLFVCRESNRIVYIDFLIDEEIEKWILSIVDNKTIVIVNSKCIQRLDTIDNCNVIIMGDTETVICDELDIKNINRFLYMMNPFVLSNLNYQNEKNIALINSFINKKITFSIKFTSYKSA